MNLPPFTSGIHSLMAGGLHTYQKLCMRIFSSIRSAILSAHSCFLLIRVSGSLYRSPGEPSRRRAGEARRSAEAGGAPGEQGVTRQRRAPSGRHGRRKGAVGSNGRRYRRPQQRQRCTVPGYANPKPCPYHVAVQLRWPTILVGISAGVALPCRRY